MCLGQLQECLLARLALRGLATQGQQQECVLLRLTLLVLLVAGRLQECLLTQLVVEGQQCLLALM